MVSFSQLQAASPMSKNYIRASEKLFAQVLNFFDFILANLFILPSLT